MMWRTSTSGPKLPVRMTVGATSAIASGLGQAHQRGAHGLQRFTRLVQRHIQLTQHHLQRGLAVQRQHHIAIGAGDLVRPVDRQTALRHA